MKSIHERAKELAPEIIANRHWLHQHPEIGFDLPLSCAYICEKLTEMGYEPKVIAQTGIVATVGKPGKTILLRADYDALIMEEEADVPYRSLIPGKMHSCGHDTHAAMLLGAAKILKEMEDELPGTVKLMFQPDEEGGGGGQAMVEAGVLENPKVDVAIAMHTVTPAKVGVIKTRSGCNSSSTDAFIITVKGKAGHGAVPSSAIDAMNTAVQIYLAFQALGDRETPPFQNIALTFGSLICGETGNIIPDKAVMKGSLRTYDPDTRVYMKKRMQEMLDGIAKTYRCSIDLEFTRSMSSVVNDRELLNFLKGPIAEVVGEENCEFDANPGAPSEDFAFVTDHVPGVYLALGFGDASQGAPLAGHHPQVIFLDDALPYGAALYANCAYEWLKANA